jgi:hypothetical protein
MSTTTDSWFPLFEFQDWTYQSSLVLPTPAEKNAPPGGAVTAKKWAKGTLLCGQAMKTEDGYTLSGRLVFRPGLELAVEGRGSLGAADSPASFEATGTATSGPIKGAVYQLVGWVFPQTPIENGAARVLAVQGSVRAVRGPDAKPDVEPGGMPAGSTVGTFAIERAQQPPAEAQIRVG